MRKNVDTMIVVPNERLLAVVGKGIPFQDALKKADEVLLHATQGIASLITTTGIINVDFADVRTVMQNGGAALMGTGIGRGENRALEAAQQAISSPLLDNVSIAGATGVLINIIGGDDLTLGETTQINDIIHDAVGDDAEIIFGAGNDPAMQGEVRVTVIATGFDRAVTGDQPARRARPAPPACINFPAAQQPRHPTPGMPAPSRRPRPAQPRVQPRVRQAPPTGRPKCPRWRSPPSSDGRWTDAGARVGAGRRGLRAPPPSSRRRGRWPWRRMPQPAAAPAAGWPAAAPPSPRSLDTLRRGETVSASLRPPRGRRTSISAASTPRSRSIPAGCAPGWSSASAQTAADSLPTRIMRPHQPRSSGSSSSRDRRRLERGGRADRLERRGGADRGRRSTTRSTRRSTRRCRDEQLDGADRQRLAWDLADVYAWQVDFTRDIQPGDRFQVRLRAAGLRGRRGPLRPGARERPHDVGQEPHRVPVRRATAGRPTTTPTATRSAAPSSGRRCSSAGSPRPSPARGSIRCSGITRRHEGTDYAAAPGTPVMAAGDGVVLRAGRAGGYGNLIELRHRNGITTRYGHLRGFARGIRAGARVEQGQIDRLRRLDRPRQRARTCTTSSGSTASPRTRGGSTLGNGAPIRRAHPRRASSASATDCCCSCCDRQRGRSRARIAQQLG